MRRMRRSVLPILRGLTAAVCAALAAVAGASGNAHLEHELCLHGKLEMAGLARAYDESTGRDERNYPPDRLVDIIHMKLELRFDDLDDRRFSATETLRMTAIGAPVASLTLDAIRLDVSSVTRAGRPVEHFVDDETITMRFEPPLTVGAATDVVFEYACEQPTAGMIFTPSDPSVPQYTAEVHTQGQAITNRHWFICHDAPNERMSTELIVDVPARFQVSSNGRLVSSVVSGDRAVWHWIQEKPHVSYLVSLVIGEFDIVELEHPRVPMKVWVPKGKGELVAGCYGNTARMLDLFEQRFGVPYPWERYDQIVVKNFAAGGMENTSVTSMFPTAILDETALRDRDLDSLIAHELAHQWSGDLVTCKDWAHIWLNEGFATYGSALWFEQRDGEDGYLEAMRRNFGVARRDRTTGEVPMVSPIYGDPWETFRRAGHPYRKGASILHMLRMALGEERFWNGLHTYMRRFAVGTAETNDLRYAFEDISGLGLEWFFDQWCYRPGTPQLEIGIDYDAGSRVLLVDVEQVQEIDARTPAFRFTLPVHVVTDAGTSVHEINVSERSTSLRVALDTAPRVVAVDPYLHVLCTMDVDKAMSFWTAQLAEGPTIVARHRAVDALGEAETTEHRRLLVELAGDARAHHALRTDAVGALRDYASDEARAELRALFEAGVDDPRVRAQLVTALADCESDEVTAVLARVAAEDPSYATRVAAIEGLGERGAADEADLLMVLTGFPSQHEQVRTAALEALADLDDPRGLDLAVRYAAYGETDRARASAVSVVGALAKHDRDRAVDFLIDLIDDPEPRPRRAAISALVELGEERAIEPLEAIARAHRDPSWREDAEGWLEELRGNRDGSADEDGDGREQSRSGRRRGG